jgi:hydroxymethylpyrimidine pyrophosphatase-like HAD family hydrolase
MGNALEELKIYADAVTADNDHNGVLEAIGDTW